MGRGKGGGEESGEQERETSFVSIDKEREVSSSGSVLREKGVPGAAALVRPLNYLEGALSGGLSERPNKKSYRTAASRCRPGWRPWRRPRSPKGSPTCSLEGTWEG